MEKNQPETRKMKFARLRGVAADLTMAALFLVTIVATLVFLHGLGM
jgi:hypothetical protein